MRHRALVLLLLFASLASCTNDDSDNTPLEPKAEGRCSADGLDAPTEPEGLPVEVAMMRKEIIKASIRCEYDSLQQLALNGAEMFNYSFGESSSRAEATPGAYWEDQEKAGEAPLETIIKLFKLGFAVTNTDEGTIYAWPSAAGEAPSSDDWTAVEREFGERSAQEWREEEGYLGPRLGITSRGDWLFYVAGGD